MISDEKRREVAASLRASANVGGARTLKRELAKALGIQLDRYTPEGSHTKILRGLADLIDQTCHLVGTTSEDGLYGPTIFSHELSCGHTCDTAWTEPPAYCCECGCMVIA